jgi:hypothetical protein
MPRTLGERNTVQVTVTMQLDDRAFLEQRSGHSKSSRG